MAQTCSYCGFEINAYCTTALGLYCDMDCADEHDKKIMLEEEEYLDELEFSGEDEYDDDVDYMQEQNDFAHDDDYHNMYDGMDYDFDMHTEGN